MFSVYPYLYTSIITIILLILVSRKLLDPEQQTLVIFSGLTNIPCFAFTVMFEGVYWTPVRLGGWVLGVEDILCAYALAALTWFATVYRFRAISREPSAFHEIIKRYCIVSGISGVAFFPFYFAGINVMTAFILMCFIVGLSLFVLYPRLRKLALAGIWKAPLVYGTMVKIYFLVWPDLALQWNTTTLWGKMFFGIPLGEIAWAISFGFYWPLFIGYVFKIKIPVREYSNN
jgi:hypothetical protein